MLAAVKVQVNPVLALAAPFRKNGLVQTELHKMGRQKRQYFGVCAGRRISWTISQ